MDDHFDDTTFHLRFGHKKNGMNGKKRSHFNSLIEAALSQKAASKENQILGDAAQECDPAEQSAIIDGDAKLQHKNGTAVQETSGDPSEDIELDATSEKENPLETSCKKLSRKERKALKKKEETEKHKAEEEVRTAKASEDGDQFACSQSAVNENDLHWKNALDIHIPSFSISAAGKVLFSDATLRISQGRRYGLVGPNGKGKSSLLKMIASQKLMLPPRIDYLYLEQECAADDTPAIDAVLKADKKLWSLLQEEKVLEDALASGNNVGSEDVERLEEIHEQLGDIGAYASEGKARKILYGLGFDTRMQNTAAKMFSGGWRMRLSLARALFVEPTLLMLDEPTNHLDLNAVIWLVDYLQNWNKMLLVVSHDQEFMNSVCEEILHIEDTKLISYKGDYDSFKALKATESLKQRKAWSEQNKQVQKEKNAKSSKGRNADTKQSVTRRPRDYTVNLEFADVAALRGTILDLIGVDFRYSPSHPLLFHGLDFSIATDSRICIAGLNGTGKSTLLKLLTGQVQPTKGEVKRNPRLRMGTYNQHFIDILPMNKTPIEFLLEKHKEDDKNYQAACKILGTCGLERHAHEIAMRDLSGGQKARVVFADLTWQRPHLLLLDEPTNNLDVETIDALVNAMQAFNGAIVVVTHDQRLIDECGCGLWIVENQSVIRSRGSFEDYKEMLLANLKKTVQREEDKAQKRREVKTAATAKQRKALQSSRKQGLAKEAR